MGEGGVGVHVRWRTGLHPFGRFWLVHLRVVLSKLGTTCGCDRLVPRSLVVALLCVTERPLRGALAP